MPKSLLYAGAHERQAIRDALINSGLPVIPTGIRFSWKTSVSFGRRFASAFTEASTSLATSRLVKVQSWG
ncbi:hypothetical protein BV22DRAFT_892413 [Leucogyrophana mollusca]|uniref:Uncharacterized protein n=1 Tax=Leucogyrophana mollusca TaxID=85980 RepID=A0ACB8AZQ5_9AGAM|nr:hypothetical protein BV22DRAFT_892413 [Leucogyrophana mollusca]